MSSGDADQRWAWLGLLKWSLAYSDGTKPSSETVKMSDEDRKFLETVMKEGIIDENERMKEILLQLTKAVESYKTISEGKTTKEGLSTEGNPPPDEEELEDMLLELRDIVEQIDYARAFAAMKGMPFLLGCAQERTAVPNTFRIACLGILATMSQNNPPLQLELLELGSIKILTKLFFEETGEDENGKLRAKIIQAMSANVRNHATAEQVFSEVEQAQGLMESALGLSSEADIQSTPDVLRKRALFFLRALITSDTSSRERVRLFSKCIEAIIENFLSNEKQPNAEVRELSLELLNQILEQKLHVNVILDNKDTIVQMGANQTAALRGLTGEDREYAAIELENWERLLSKVETTPRDDEGTSDATPLMLSDTPSNPPTETLPQ